MSDPRPFECCPFCGEVVHITRQGPAGVWKTRDSHILKCEPCNKTFNSQGGETWKEAHGGVP